MRTAAICRVVGGALIVLIGVALAIGGVQLWRGGPTAWPEIIADARIVAQVSGGMLVMAVLMLVSGVAAIGNVPWGRSAGSSATVFLVIAAFWANQALFGDIRMAHTVINVVVAAIIVALLRYGFAHPGAS